MLHRVVVPESCKVVRTNVCIAHFLCVFMTDVSVKMLRAAPPILAFRTTHPFDCSNTSSFFVHIIEICLLANSTARRSHYHFFRKLPCDLGDILGKLLEKWIRIIRTSGDHVLEPLKFILQIGLSPRQRQDGERIYHPF